MGTAAWVATIVSVVSVLVAVAFLLLSLANRKRIGQLEDPRLTVRKLADPVWPRDGYLAVLVEIVNGASIPDMITRAVLDSGTKIDACQPLQTLALKGFLATDEITPPARLEPRDAKQGFLWFPIEVSRKVVAKLLVYGSSGAEATCRITVEPLIDKSNS